MEETHELTLPCYWWRDLPNFGDAMSPWILEQVLRLPIAWTSNKGKLIGLGSILWAAEPGDVVWGTGLHPYSESWKPNWSAQGINFLAVRGPLSRKLVIERGGDCPDCFGDPGELLPYFYQPQRFQNSTRVGILPHIFDDAGRAFASNYQGANLIDPKEPWQKVVNQILACEVIWSSSLHGLIVAEAYGIPAVWVRCSEGATKYLDYYAASNRTGNRPVDWPEASSISAATLPVRVEFHSHPLIQAIQRWRPSIANFVVTSRATVTSI